MTTPESAKMQGATKTTRSAGGVSIDDPQFAARIRGGHNLVAELQKKAGPQELIEKPLVVVTGRIEGA